MSQFDFQKQFDSLFTAGERTKLIERPRRDGKTPRVTGQLPEQHAITAVTVDEAGDL
jgi:hypothetical protein